jgi:hypothetical protein
MLLSLSWWLWDWVCVVSRRTPFSVPTKHASTMMYYVSMTQKDMKVITVRVPSDIHAAVMAAAKEDRRSMTAYLQLLLEQHLADLKADDLLHE